MCLPTRRTFSMVLPVSAAAISVGVERNGSGFEPSQTETIFRPRARASTPLATVSTSGSSGIGISRGGRQSNAARPGLSALMEAPCSIGFLFASSKIFSFESDLPERSFLSTITARHTILCAFGSTRAHPCAGMEIKWKRARDESEDSGSFRGPVGR